MPSLVEIGPVVLKKKILKFRQCILNLLFHNYIPLKKDVVLHLNKQEYPSPKDALIQVCMVEIGLMVLEMKMKM